jgi:transcriptional regulator with XRE-family HTH domain
MSELSPEQDTVGFRIKRARGYRGLGQAELARQIGLSATALSQIERGKTADPASSIIAKIAVALEIRTDFLLGLTDKIEKDFKTAEAA